MKFKILFSFTLFFLLISADDNQTEKIFNKEYFPLKNNSSSKLKSNLGSIEGTVVFNGKEFIMTYKSSSITYQQNFIINDKGVFVTRTENKAFMFGSVYTYSKPLLRIPFPVKQGQTWEWSGYEFEDGDNDNKRKIFLKGLCLGEEQIIAGKTKYNCIKIQIEIFSEDGSVNKLTEWLAPNIGIVKETAKIQGNGISGLIQKFMGLNEIYFELLSYK